MSHTAELQQLATRMKTNGHAAKAEEPPAGRLWCPKCEIHPNVRTQVLDPKDGTIKHRPCGTFCELQDEGEATPPLGTRQRPETGRQAARRPDAPQGRRTHHSAPSGSGKAVEGPIRTPDPGSHARRRPSRRGAPRPGQAARRGPRRPVEPARRRPRRDPGRILGGLSS